MIATTTQQTQRCLKCAEVQPLDQFRLHCKGDPTSRVRECRSCHNGQERVRQRAKRLKLSGTKLNVFARMVGKSSRPRDTHRLVDVMVRKYGGTGGFADAWCEHLDAASEKDIGGRTVGNGLIALLRMVEHCEPEPLDLGHLDQQDLERAMVQSFANGIRGNPGLVIGILQEVGYTVLPPSE